MCCLVFDEEQVTDKKFENKVEWGIDLASEHERQVKQVGLEIGEGSACAIGGVKYIGILSL